MWELFWSWFAWLRSHFCWDLGQILRYALLPTHPQRPKWASNSNHGPFISNGLLFVLHGIHTNMIAWCRSIFGHDLDGGEAIFVFAQIWGRFCATAPTYPQRPKWASNPNHSPFMPKDVSFVLYNIHSNMIAWFRSFSCHDLVGGKAIFGEIWGRFCATANPPTEARSSKQSQSQPIHLQWTFVCLA